MTALRADPAWLSFHLARCLRPQRGP